MRGSSRCLSFFFKEAIMEERTSLHRLNTLKILQIHYRERLDKDMEALRYIDEEIIKLVKDKQEL